MISAEANETVYTHFFGVRRSGNHPVIHWMQQGYADAGQPALHFNSVAGYPILERYPDHMRREIAVAKARRAILSYEDVPYRSRYFSTHYREFDGPGANDVILVRSFPNMVASRLQRMRNLEREGGNPRLHHGIGWSAISGIWADNASAAVQSEGQPYTHSVLYDRWVADTEYRDSLAQELGFNNHDLGLDFVPSNADGSSFDNLAYQGRAQDMDTLGRWRMLLQDEEGRQILQDFFTGKVAELNGELFGYESVEA